MAILDSIFDEYRSRRQVQEDPQPAANIDHFADTAVGSLGVEVIQTFVEATKQLALLDKVYKDTARDTYNLIDQWLVTKPSEKEKEYVNLRIFEETGLRLVYTDTPAKLPPPKKKVELAKEHAEYLESFLLPYRVEMTKGGNYEVSVTLPFSSVIAPETLAGAFCRVVENFNVDEFGHVIVAPSSDPCYE